MQHHQKAETKLQEDQKRKKGKSTENSLEKVSWTWKSYHHTMQKGIQNQEAKHKLTHNVSKCPIS